MGIFIYRKLDNLFDSTLDGNKLMKDVEAKRMEATYYSATFGLKVGDPYIGTRFQYKVINIANKRKVRLENLRKAGSKIQGSTTRGNDTLREQDECPRESSKEKRKRMDEVGPSERLENKEQKSRETNKAIVEEKSKQEATLTFKLALDIKTTIDIRKNLETRILDRKVDLNLKKQP